MDLRSARDKVRQWLVDVFTGAITRLDESKQRAEAIHWLGRSRAIIASNKDTAEKLRQLKGLIDSRSMIRVAASRIMRTVANYRSLPLPLSLKIALPVTFAAVPFVGGQAAGIAALGGAIGIPVLLLVFLGVSGITSIIEAVIAHPSVRTDIAEVVELILEDERLRQASAAMKAAMRNSPRAASRAEVPQKHDELAQHLLTMDPFLFEQHVMSFFELAGLEAWATTRSNDFGVDGFAIHPQGLMIVQCKRYSSGEKVGRPAVQQFKGVIEEQGAWRGYLVTTADFTAEAVESASRNEKLLLVALKELINWHHVPPDFLHAP